MSDLDLRNRIVELEMRVDQMSEPELRKRISELEINLEKLGVSHTALTKSVGHILGLMKEIVEEEPP